MLDFSGMSEIIASSILHVVETFNEISKYRLGFCEKSQLTGQGLIVDKVNICQNCDYECPIKSDMDCTNSFFCFNGYNLYIMPLNISKLSPGILYGYSPAGDYRELQELVEKTYGIVEKLLHNTITVEQVEGFSKTVADVGRLADLSRDNLAGLLNDLHSIINCDLLVYSIKENDCLKPFMHIGIDKNNLREINLTTGLESWVLFTRKAETIEVNVNDLRLKNSIFKELKEIGKVLLCVPVVDDQDVVYGLLYASYKEKNYGQLKYYKQILIGFCSCLALQYAKTAVREKYEKQLAYFDVFKKLSSLPYLTAESRDILNPLLDLAATVLTPKTLAIFDKEFKLIIARSSTDTFLGELKNGNNLSPYLQVPLGSSTDDRQGLLVFDRDEPLAEDEGHFLKIIGNFISLSLGMEEHINHYGKMLKGVLRALAKIVEMKDPYTYGHSERVSKYSYGLALQAGLSEKEAENIANAAFLHDIGKITIPDKVLLKKDDLTAKEKEQINSHPVKGAEIVRSLFNAPHIYEVVRHHHERLDGTGYPDGLVGDQIPLPAKIVAITDGFEAMISQRVYRMAMTPHEAYQNLLSEAGEKYDPKLVKLFYQVIKDEMVFKFEEDRRYQHDNKIFMGKITELTAREREVLALLAKGYNNQEIARKLYITEQTVKSHVSKILQKLEVEDRTKAAVYALKSGWF